MALHGRQVPISSKNTRQARSAHARAKEAVKTYDTSAIRPKRSKMPIVALIIVLVAVLAIVAVLLFSCNRDAETLAAGEEAVVVVEQGEDATSIANALLDAKVIGNTQKFIDLLNQRDAASSLIPGTYLFTGETTSDEVLDILLTGPEATAFSLVVPEGYTRAQIAADLETVTSGRITAQQFLDATADASAYAAEFTFLESAGQNPLEGYLFPKTYAVTVLDSAATVTRMMLDQFATETQALDLAYPTARNLSLDDMVTLASIVEKEGKPDNYARVASVFYNRLASSRPYLESDATTAYEVGHDPSGEEVHADTPYSTYAHPGLPPTPICCPSLLALQAVCAPEETAYLYFYSYDDGTYVFSETYEQHQSTYQ